MDAPPSSPDPLGPPDPGTSRPERSSALDRDDLRQRVQKALNTFVAAQQPVLDAVGPELGSLTDALADLLAGGKRLRPAFCYWGYRGGGGPDSEQIVGAAAALELFQACAIVHDDVMDASDTRRGRPAAHRRFAALHRGNGWLGDPEAFGRGAAILLGDLALAWSDQMLWDSGLAPPDLRRAQRMYDEMRAELMGGQYLDLLEQARGGGSVERALRVARFKSARYTIERPLRLGGLLADAGAEVLSAYGRYGLPLGEAFQLRDDVLGVFGDPAETGKPAGDDLREGKRTVLVAAALERATPAQAALVRQHLGDPHLSDDGVQELRDVLVRTGAVERVERLVADRVAQAVEALQAAPVADDARDVLTELAAAATTRTG